MAGLTNAQMVSEVETLIEISGTDVDTSVLRYLNMAGRELWISHPWRLRKKEAVITTVATYATGTITATLASTQLLGSGTTFTAAMVGRKFTLGLGGPTYRIAAYVSATELTLARAYQEATTAGASYVLFQDEYDVASDVDQVASIELLYSRYRGRLRMCTQGELDAGSYNTSATGIPQAWSPCTETTAGTYRIRLWPIPDAIYGMRVLYYRTWTEITAADGTFHALGVEKDRLVLLATTLIAQKIPGTPQVTSEQEVYLLCEAAWQKEQMQTTLAGERRAFDDFYTFTNDIQIDTTTL